MKRALVGLAAIALVLRAGAAFADPTPEDVERARTFFNAGAQAYASARYGDAARAFEQAYALAPRPQLLFSLAQAEKKQFFATNDGAMIRRAIEHYRLYLEQVPSGGRRSEATEAKADLEARLARLDPSQVAPARPPEVARKARVTLYSATPGAHASIDGGPPQEVPYFGDLDAGKHRIRVFADGYFDEERDLSVDRPIDIPLDVTLKDRPAKVTVAYAGSGDVFVDGRLVATAPVSGPIDVAPGPHVLSIAVNGKKPLSQDVVLERGKPFRFEPRVETSGQRVVAIGVLAAGAASLVTGGVFMGLALGRESTAKDIAGRRATGNISASDLDRYNRAIDDRDTFRSVSIVTLSAGAALAVGGAALYFFDHPTIAVVPPRSTEPQPSPRGQSLDVAAYPLLVPGAVGGGVVGRF